ncbi:MAG: dehypoxanthine futalosine cyclase, partial [Acidobacteria bacterium]|nr:dehypoxanthine futalosine cyclase [Acidobacteriota bacterium]
MSVTALLDRAANRERLTESEWLQVINEAATEDLRSRADALRREYHPDNV